MLAQKKSAIEEILPYQTIPYDLYIGYYLYDGDVEKIIGQVPKWKNAAEGTLLPFHPDSSAHLNLDTISVVRLDAKWQGDKAVYNHPHHLQGQGGDHIHYHCLL